MELAVLTISSVTNIAVGAFILLSNFKSHTNRLFFAFTLFAALWATLNYLSLHQTTPEDTLNAIRWVMFFAILHSASLFLMVHTFPEQKIRLSTWKLLTFLGFALIVLILTRTPLIFESVNGFGANASPNPGAGIPLFALMAGFSILGSIYILASRYKKAIGVLRIQLRYLLYGVIGSTLMIFISNFVLVVFFNTTVLLNLGPTFTLIFVVATAYAITKHGLFNTKVILAEISAAALVLVNIAQLFFARNTGEFLFRLLVFLLVTFFAFIFVRSVKNEVRRRVEFEELAKEKIQALDELEQRNRNLATLQKISDIVLNESDMKIMVQKILDELPKELEGCIGGMLSVVKQGQLTGYSMSSNNFSKKIISLVGGDLNKYSHPISREFNLIHRAIIDKESISSDKLTDFISPPISKPVALSIQKLIGVRHVEAFPLIAGGEPLGVMLFVFSKTKEEIHSKNYSIAKAISDDMSLAIQRAQAFVQLKEANEYLSELDKMKDEFISMASHELNTPLAAIEGYLSMILDEGMGKIDKQSRKYLNRAYASSKRLAELIMDLLNVSRIEQGRLKMKYAKTNMAELAQSVIHELQIKADEKKLYLKLVADKTAPKTWFDPERIREVIVNLMGNALKFTDKGGATIKIKNSGKKILVEIIDTGRGVAKADQGKLFHKFSQIKRDIDEHQGSGLGLYISKNFIELHKGKIWVDSDAGQGSTFSFEIPIITKPPKEVEGAIFERSVKTAPIETPKKDLVPEIITDSTKEGR